MSVQDMHTRSAGFPPAEEVDASYERPAPWLTYGGPPLGGSLLIAIGYLTQGGPAARWAGMGVLVAALLAAAFLVGRRRKLRVLHWDPIGVVATGSLTLLLTVALAELVRAPGSGLGRLSGTALAVGAFGVVLSVAVATMRAQREHLSLRAIPRRAMSAWEDPTAGWGTFVLGALLALPFLPVHIDVARTTDSVRLLASILHVQREGPGFLVQTQEVLLPHLTLGPVVAMAGVPGAVAFSLGGFVALAGVVSYLTWTLGRSALGAAAAVLLLVSLPPLVGQANALTGYPQTMALAYLGGWCAHVAMTRPDRRWLPALASAALLTLAAESHAVGLIFLAAPALLLAARPSRERLRSAAAVYAVVALLFVPRLAVNLWEGGLANITSSRTEWMITSGHLQRVNAVFHEHGTDASFFSYLGGMLSLLSESLGWTGLIAAGLAVASLAVAGRGAAWLALLAVTVVILGLEVRRPPPFPRYLTPLMPGAGILLGIAVARMRDAGRWRRYAVLATVLALAAIGTASAIHAVETARRQERLTQEGHLPAFARRIPPGDGVIGARPQELLTVTTDIRVFGAPFLTEEEFLTYLSWPSDRAVIRLLQSRDIGWVYITNKRLEVGYHETWTIPVHGRPVRHFRAIRRSPAFCRVAKADDSGHSLYRLGPCEG